MKLYFVKLKTGPNETITRQNIFLQPLRHYGYQIEEIKLEEIVEKSKEPNCSIMIWEWYSENVISNIDILYDHHTRFNSKIILLTEQPWRYETQLLRINNFLLGKNNKNFIKLFQNSEGIFDQYTMMECGALQSSEAWYQLDFIFYIVNHWLQEKNQQKKNKFLYLAGGRSDEFRQNFLISANMIADPLSLNIVSKSSVDGLYQRTEDIKKIINEKFNGANFIGGFGSGLPPLDLYAETQIEIAIETMHLKNYCHITGKTWRPFLCKMPVIILMGEGNYKNLLKMGYRIPFEEFYFKYFAINSIKDKIKYFLDFLLQNKDDEEFYKNATIAANYNFEHFWYNRSKKPWKDLINQHKKIFGFSPLEELKKYFV
jgi:hypothetical protein